MLDVFARPVTITPIASQGVAAPDYAARGYYDTRPFDVAALDGSVVTDQQTIFPCSRVSAT